MLFYEVKLAQHATVGKVMEAHFPLSLSIFSFTKREKFITKTLNLEFTLFTGDEAKQ